MEISEMQATIAFQVAHTKPDHLIPGLDVGFDPGRDEYTLVVRKRDGWEAEIVYDIGPDLYNVFITPPGGDVEAHEGVFCDQLGELIWGEDAKNFSLPMVEIWAIDDDGEPHKVDEF